MAVDNVLYVIGGSVTLAALITGFGLLAKTIGKFIEDNPSVLKNLVVGGLIIAGIGALLGILGLMLPGYIELAIRTGERWGDVWAGSLSLIGLIGVFGLLMAGIGALVMNPIVLLCIGVGALTILGLAGLMVVLGTAVSAFMDMLTVLTNEHDVKAGAEKVQMAVTEMAGIIKSIGKMVLNPFTAIAIGAGAVALVGIALAIKALKSAMLDYFHMIEEMKQFSVKDMLNFRDFVIGDKDSFVDVVTTIIDKLNDIGIIATAKAAVIS